MVTRLKGSGICLFPLLFMILLMFSCSSREKPEVNIIPRPLLTEVHRGYFLLSEQTRIKVESEDPVVRNIARNFSQQLAQKSGLEIPVAPAGDRISNHDILLHLDYNLMEELGMEGYLLHVGGKKMEVTAAWPNGIYYGLQTVCQLLPSMTFTDSLLTDRKLWKIPCVDIKDRPAYYYRGMHLDVSRHFFPVEFIRKYIDLIAMHKMNVFHWHLTDDNGWRIQILEYPELTSVSAWRVDREDKSWKEREPQQPGEEATYGGYYTREQIKEIIQYAKERFVEVIPEIEMPGHSSEVFAAYPELSCTGERLSVQPGSYWPNDDIFCAGNEKTFEFLDKVLTEVAGLFPSPYVHIGGDEADKAHWETCQKCQTRMIAEGLHNTDELQSYFIRRIDEMLKDKGKKLIGWDEILDGGLAPDAMVMSWRGMDGGIEAAQEGHDVIMCPTSHAYFDYYQDHPETEPEAIGGFTPLSKVYSFRPVPPSLSPEEARHILGGQGNLWTEYIATPQHAEYMALPRMTAMAEVLWTREDLLDWDDFMHRLPAQFRRFDAMGVNYSKSSFRAEAGLPCNSPAGD